MRCSLCTPRGSPSVKLKVCLASLVPLRFSCANVQAIHLELVGSGLTGRTRKGFAAPRDVHIDEPGVFDRGKVLCFQQSATNSSSPEFDVLTCRGREVLVHDDVPDLEPATRFEDSESLSKD